MERFISVQYHGRNEMLMLGAANVCMSVSQHVSSACTWQRLQTCLLSWAVLHKALHLCQVYRSSLPHRFFLRETQWKFKVEIKKTHRGKAPRLNSLSESSLGQSLSSFMVLLLVPGKNHFKYFLFVGPNPLSRIKTVWLTLLDV